MLFRRTLAALGIDTKKTQEVLTLAVTMYDGMEADKVTYNAPNPPLPVFLGLIQTCTSSQQAVVMRTKGAAATRDADRALLLTGIENERMFVQTLADATPSRAVALIQNVGLVIRGSPGYTKGLLTLRLGVQPGSVICDANVGLLVSAAATHPSQNRFFNWEYTLDGGSTFVTMPSTTKGKTMIQNLVPLTKVGVRVNLNLGTGPGPWSQVVTIQLH